MKQIISIEENKDLIPDKILCEWGEKHCCIAAWSSAQNKIAALEYFLFPSLTADVLKQLIDKIKSFLSEKNKVFISSAFPQAVLVPAKFYKDGAGFIEPIYGAPAIQLHDAIEQWQVVNTYSMPPGVYKELELHIPGANYIHVYTTGLKVYNGFIAHDSLSVHFTPYNFWVIAKKGAHLLLAQMYPYQTPLDVVYYLLKITEEFSLPKEELAVIISGLVEASSGLYEEINNYFLNVQFAVTPPVVKEDKHPAHYFTSVYNLSACAL